MINPEDKDAQYMTYQGVPCSRLNLNAAARLGYLPIGFTDSKRENRQCDM
ncbi:MAG: hypothetical protein WAK17_28375 [Candidatus Nitrosopolaris sp.]|jgi:hypothetical protein